MPTVDVTPVLLDCKVHDLLSCHAALLSQLLLCSAPLTYGSYGFNRWTMEIDSTQYLRTLGKKYKIGLDCIKWWKIAGHWRCSRPDCVPLGGPDIDWPEC